MKDIMAIRYVMTQQPTLNQGAHYRCDIDLTDDLIYGQRGLNLLVQLVIIELLKTPGRDVINPRDGGGLLNLRGISPFGDDKAKARTMVALAIKRVEQQILTRQLGQNYPASETLKTLECGDELYWDTQAGSWYIPVTCTSLSGEAHLMDVPLPSTGDIS